ncbi:hypothetical protein PUV47_02540 [Pseudovibrio exalbescens]|uniref:hypothetical protein n=1 Tax=Pseudovibrio exalbescens TaxID=197461 RepID=UPI002365B164|nr:hypothetical protein [Pseudovibrio exalbescens]MDD7908783.1 hypothetical protein [Pseudovibrio exalbescens]
MRRLFVAVLRPKILLILYVAFPFAIWLGCVAIMILVGNFTDCMVHEGFPNPCMIAGVDVGDTLYSIGMIAAWGLLMVPLFFGYTALPFALVCGLVWWVRKSFD